MIPSFPSEKGGAINRTKLYPPFVHPKRRSSLGGRSSPCFDDLRERTGCPGCPGFLHCMRKKENIKVIVKNARTSQTCRTEGG